MFKKILIPIDFSDCANNALEWALQIFHQPDVNFVLLHAYHIPVPHVELGSTSIIEPLIEGYEEEIQNKKEALFNKYPELQKKALKFEIVHAFTNDAILSTVDQFAIDLIIMGTHGAKGTLEEFLGTMTSLVIKEVDVPVLAIPRDAKQRNIEKIAFATDLELLEGKEQIAPLMEFIELCRAKTYVIHVKKSESTLDDEKQAVKDILDFYFSDYSHSFIVIEAENEEKAIVEYIKEHDLQLISVMPRKHDFFEKIFKKSFTKQIAFHSTIPLFVFH